jgi:hypothetical protein
MSQDEEVLFEVLEDSDDDVDTPSRAEAAIATKFQACKAEPEVEN